MKEEFLSYIGKPDSLNSYSRSYKLVFYKCFFELMDASGYASAHKVSNQFREYYLKRKHDGKIPDKDVDARIANIETSSVEDVYTIILNNPFKYISERKYILQRKDANGKDQFYLAPQLVQELSQEDLQDIRALVDTKLELYFSGIDEKSTISLHDLFDRILNEYIHSKSETFANHAMGRLFRQDVVEALYKTIIDRDKYLVKGSVGQGTWATVPWVSIFDPRVTTSATHGVYIVYLLSADGKTLYLTLNQGCTDLSNSVGKVEAIRQMRQVAQKVISSVDCGNFETSNSISLGNDLPSLAQMYEAGCICFKKYEQRKVPSEEVLRRDLTDLLNIYQQYVALQNEEPTPSIMPSFWKISHGNAVFTSEEKAFYEQKRLAVVAADTKKKGRSKVSQSDDFMETMKAGDVFYLCYGNSVQYLCRLTSNELVPCPEKGENWFGRPYEMIAKAIEQIPYSGKSYWWAPNNNSTCIRVPENDLFPFEQNILKPYFDISIEELTGQMVVGGEEEMSVKDTIGRIKNYITAKGFSYNDGLIENFYLSLKSKPFVILAGTSGTGKTRLVKLFAEAVGSTSANGRYKLVPVRPDWSDSSDLFGHLDLNGKFVPGAIIDFVKKAEIDSVHPYFLCLDEMNLARVEYYFSDVLSIIETRDFDSSGKIVSDPLVPDTYFGTDADSMGRYGKISLPENLYIIGTVNMDETTFPFSRKVLDRANTIEFSYVDLLPQLIGEEAENERAQDLPNTFWKTKYLLLSQCATETEFVNELCTELQKINRILQYSNTHVGYRVRDEIIFYMLNNKNDELLNRDDALDNEIMQKILPRIQGSSASIKNMLCELFKHCAGDYEGYQTEDHNIGSKMYKAVQGGDCKYKQSAQKIAFMVRRYEEDGFTSYWL
ncbi:ATPase family protein [Desulfitobacterium hafniense DP7]|uniref:ATPase family protein n=1 Tax=Desulfitobacterium hafniense DP7 TaxID=537010 RepID=G9XPY4_DESHA|nr:DUF3578 domain-containing protein [Desulfitobacterium hafniense]EHL06278.1 ATPase family protein [Desulfitobacterium hafniense DP7]